ncbi:MAG: hypothetical protein M0R18_08460 [Deltaproteobacteria bacterium]|nr:hypothetical protein [Deltaproteobacteria bacterium]
MGNAPCKPVESLDPLSLGQLGFNPARLRFSLFTLGDLFLEQDIPRFQLIEGLQEGLLCLS